MEIHTGMAPSSGRARDSNGNMAMHNGRILVGDLGGTHARFAVVDTGPEPMRIECPAEFEARLFATFDAALDAYLEQLGGAPPEAVSLAVAGPVTQGGVRFTNSGWTLAEEDLRARGFAHALLINDFAALAFSVSALGQEAFRAIGPDLEGLAGEPITILGAGTGLGVSCLARWRGRVLPVATEGGHMSFAPRGDRQTAVLSVLAKRFGHVSLERVLSGPGLENIYSALEEIAGRKPEPLDAEEISRRAAEGNADCRTARDMFCSIYGAAAGDFALAHGARGGVYIAGGIAGKILDDLLKSGFRAAFEDKGRLSDYVKAIPTRLILHEDTAFLGAACASLQLR